MESISSQPKIMSRPRTAGDGMEATNKGEASQSYEFKSKPSSKETLPIGRLVQVYPSNTVKFEKKNTHTYAKNPKFVPYEPYPGAVKPIIPPTMAKGLKKTGSKNNMDINTLITQMSQMDTKLNEFKPRPKLISAGDKNVVDDEKPCQEKVEMQKKIENLISENEALKEQLKQQAQVNKELKTMLVASMGEDLETQVNSLNEDKKHLANALINSAQHLSTHQEQTEWLAGQCEVWRSKFLASSLMVEELANWKRVLNERTNTLQQAIQQLFDEKHRARELLLHTYRNLYSLHEKWLQNVALSDKMFNQPLGNFNLTASMPPTSNILDLASVTLKLSENVTSHVEKQDISQLYTLPATTDAEKYAENILAMPIEVKKVNEEPVNALVHHAYNSSGSTVRPIASCVHCNGRVQLL